MIHRINPLKRILIGVLFPLIFSGCLLFNGLTGDPNAGDQHGLALTMKDAYQGVKDGNVESVPLLEDSTYVTVEVCVENRSVTEQIVHGGDVFLTTENNGQIFPVALGYDQAEAFDWILPMAEPIGGKRIEHRFFFFPIQNDEVLRIPAYQSQGCSNSAQFKSLALLFIVQKDMVDRLYTLHFLEENIPFAAKMILPLSDYVKWGVGLGFLFILIVVAIIVVRKRRAEVQASLE